MTESHLVILAGLFLVLCFIGVWWYDRKLVKQIEEYEERLERKGILKRHYTKSKRY